MKYMKEITVVELQNRLKARKEGKDEFHLLDVRLPNEVAIATIPGSDLLIPIQELPNRVSELDAWKNDGTDLLIFCRSGNRSGTACNLLESHGFHNTFNVKGGVLAWSDQVDNTVKKY